MPSYLSSLYFSIISTRSEGIYRAPVGDVHDLSASDGLVLQPRRQRPRRIHQKLFGDLFSAALGQEVSSGIDAVCVPLDGKSPCRTSDRD